MYCLPSTYFEGFHVGQVTLQAGEATIKIEKV
jgi:hypothetical protein